MRVGQRSRAASSSCEQMFMVVVMVPCCLQSSSSVAPPRWSLFGSIGANRCRNDHVRRPSGNSAGIVASRVLCGSPRMSKAMSVFRRCHLLLFVKATAVLHSARFRGCFRLAEFPYWVGVGVVCKSGLHSARLGVLCRLAPLLLASGHASACKFSDTMHTCKV